MSKKQFIEKIYYFCLKQYLICRKRIVFVTPSCYYTGYNVGDIICFSGDTNPRNNGKFVIKSVKKKFAVPPHGLRKRLQQGNTQRLCCSLNFIINNNSLAGGKGMKRKDANKLIAMLEMGENDPDCPKLQKHVSIDRQLYINYFIRLIHKQVPEPSFFSKLWYKISYSMYYWL